MKRRSSLMAWVPRLQYEQSTCLFVAEHLTSSKRQGPCILAHRSGVNMARSFKSISIVLCNMPLAYGGSGGGVKSTGVMYKRHIAAYCLIQYHCRMPKDYRRCFPGAVPDEFIYPRLFNENVKCSWRWTNTTG